MLFCAGGLRDHHKMPRAIISPSVLASDFGQLTAECKRMIVGGAEWLHMGQSLRRQAVSASHRIYADLLCSRRYGRVISFLQVPRIII